MSSYLLLRDNKETGPLSLEELVQMGLKPYDLIWVPGKSAAWRYAGEIPELKAYAPAVEEQPFDRFFKKDAPGKAMEESADATTALPVTGGRVFVTMPGKTRQPVQGQKKAKNEVSVPDYSQYERYQPVTQQSTTAAITVTENPVAAANRQFASQDEEADRIADRYAETLRNRKAKMASRALVLRWMRKAAVVLMIAGVGGLTGWMLRKNSGTAQQEPQLIAVAPSQPVTIQQQQQQQPETGAAVVPDLALQTTSEQHAPSRPDPVARPEQHHAMITPATAVAAQPATPLAEASKKIIPADVLSPGVEVNSLTGERSRKTRAANGDDPISQQEVAAGAVKTGTNKTIPASNDGSGLSSQVAISNNAYKVVALGGIRGLELTVTNSSKYTLDDVIVEVDYLRVNNDAVKTQSLSFKDVAPGESATVRVPDTNRGVKIKYRVAHILCTQYAKDMAGL